MTDEAREASRAYKRDWYKANKEKQRRYNEKYWQKKYKLIQDRKEHNNDD